MSSVGHPVAPGASGRRSFVARAVAHHNLRETATGLSTDAPIGVRLTGTFYHRPRDTSVNPVQAERLAEVNPVASQTREGRASPSHAVSWQHGSNYFSDSDLCVSPLGRPPPGGE